MPSPTVTDINNILVWFQQLDKPNQEQFANTLWSFRHKNDKINIDDLEDDLQTILNNANSNKGLVVLAPGTISWQSPQGTFLDDVVILGGAVDEYNVSIGITEEGTELVNNELVIRPKGVLPVKHYCEVARTIYFTGVDEEAIIKLYIK